MSNSAPDTAVLEPSFPDEAAPALALSRFSVRAVFEPSVLSRVIELFALRDLVPEQVTCRRPAEAPGELRIDLAVCGLADMEADHLACRMRQFPTVVGVVMEHRPKV